MIFVNAPYQWRALPDYTTGDGQLGMDNWGWTTSRGQMIEY